MFVSGLHFHILTRREGQAVLLVNPTWRIPLSMCSAGIGTPFKLTREMSDGLGAVFICPAHLPFSSMHTAVGLPWDFLGKTHDHVTSGGGVQCSFCSRT